MSSRGRRNKLSITLGMVYGLFLVQFKTWRSYKWVFVFYFVNTLIGAMAYTYLGSAVTYSGSLSQYGDVNFLAYLLIGMAFFTYLNESLRAAQKIINPWTLEHQLLTTVSLPILLIGTSLWMYLQNTLTIATYLGVGFFLFSVGFNVNIISAAITMFLGFLTMWGFGMMPAGFQIVTKQWNPVTWTFSVLSMLVAGVYFPPEILPYPLQLISRIMPQYYILDLIRKSTLCSFTPFQLWPGLLNLAILSLVVFPLGYLSLKKGINRARKDGTLAHF